MQGLSSPGRTRPLALACIVAAQFLVLLAIAYLVLGRADLPSFFPHALGTAARDDATDVPMAAVSLGGAAAMAYGAHYAQTHRSWMRTQRWHRKHGRV